VLVSFILESTTYGVVLHDADTNKIFVQKVPARTPATAIGIAENLHSGCKAIELRVPIIGRCAKCKQPRFSEAPSMIRFPDRCQDCQ